MNTFTKIFFGALVCGALFVSCKKTGVTPAESTTAFVSFSANGSSKTYKKAVFETLKEPGTNYNLTEILGSDTVDNKTAHADFSIEIFHVDDLKAGGVYLAERESDLNSPTIAASYFTWNQDSTYKNLYQELFADSVGSVILTEVTSDHIKGTFTCHLYNAYNEPGPVYTISQGSFYATLDNDLVQFATAKPVKKPIH